MPWARTDVREQRVKFVVRAASGKEGMSALCREFGISRPTGYRWRKRFVQAGSVIALQERSRRPVHSPARTAPAWEERVVALRQEHGWGAKKIAVMLSEAGTALPLITINRILKRRGLVENEPRQYEASRRFERAAPNQLWQMDGKGEYRVSDGTCYPLSILDDHSRFAVGLYGLPNFTAELVHGCVVRTFERYGVPEAMLMDRGSLWWSTTNGYGLTWLAVRLIEQGIALNYGGVRHPQTQGKVERFHRTLDQALRHDGVPEHLAQWPERLEEFRHIYNEVRPHEALSMKRPRQRYRESTRAYQAQPREWEYPSGSVVRRLNPAGCVYWLQRLWFVSEALAGRWVRLETVREAVLVSYRHMYVRELDLQRRSTRSLVVARELDGEGRPPSGLPAIPVNPQTDV